MLTVFKPYAGRSFVLAIGLALAGCGNPLDGIEEYSELGLTVDKGVAAALSSQEELEREDTGLSSLLPRQDLSDDVDAALQAVLVPEAEAETEVAKEDPNATDAAAPKPRRGGVLGWLARRVPKPAAEDTPDADPVELASLEQPDTVTDAAPQQ
jgi:hypothetical protein